jgi:hypothetical protein
VRRLFGALGATLVCFRKQKHQHPGQLSDLLSSGLGIRHFYFLKQRDDFIHAGRSRGRIAMYYLSPKETDQQELIVLQELPNAA